VKITEFTGLVFEKIDTTQDYLRFSTSNGDSFRMFHQQKCCEDVTIENICGNISDLIGSPITLAEESQKISDPNEKDSYTWTFYKLATLKGYVTIRWYGTSNGDYSEEVTIIKECR